MVAITANLLAQLGLLNGCALNLQAILDVAVCPNGVALDLPTGWATDAGDNALVLLKGGATKHKRDTCEAKTTGAAATGAAATGAVPSAVNTPASQVTSALAATSGVPSGVVPSAVIPSGAVPTGATTKVPGAVTTGTGAVPTVVPTASATTGLPATSVTTGLSTATGTCSTSPVTVDPLDVSLGLDVADTVSLQVLLGVLDLINADLDVSIDLAGLLDLMVKLNINILDLVDLNLDVDTSLGGLINALVNLDLNISVGDLLNLNLDLGVDLSPLSDLGDDVAVTLGDILNLVDCTVDNVVAVVDGLLTGIAPIIGDVLHIVDTLVTDVLGTVNSLLSALIHKREGDVFAAAKNPVQHGTITCFLLDRRRTWLALGTSHGIVDIWDLRFQMRVKSWGLPGKSCIHRITHHPARGHGKWICIAGGTGLDEVTTWSIETGECREIYRILGSQMRTGIKGYTAIEVDDDSSKDLLGYHAANIEMEGTKDCGIRALAMGTGVSSNGMDIKHAFMLSGGTDRRLRFWDMAVIENSCIYSGSDAGEKVEYSTLHQAGSCVVGVEQTRKITEAPAGAGHKKRGKNTVVSKEQLGLLRGHLDCVLDVAMLEHPFTMSISVDRSGVVHIFQ